MKEKKTVETENKKVSKKKRPYQKPTIVTEELMSFGALCNGTSTGGRKAAAGAPTFCNPSRLTS